MSQADNQRLFDISTRLAVYVEGVKANQTRQFNSVIKQVNILVTNLLGHVKYRNLDGLSKTEINRLLITLRKSQSRIYSKYTEQLIQQLQEFTFINLEVNRRIWVSAHIEKKGEPDDELENLFVVEDNDAIQYIVDIQEEDENDKMLPLWGSAPITGNDDRMWGIVTGTPIPSNGMFLLPFIRLFAMIAQANIEHAIRKAWTNKLTVEETLASIVGTGEIVQGTPTELSKIKVHSTAVINTTVAHPAAIVLAGVTSALFTHYMWVSVMDSRTTDICRSRNHNVYRYGQGPLPPAHMNCRSSIAPLWTKSDLVQQSLAGWVARQPASLGIALDADGKLKVKPLTNSEFGDKVDDILKDDE